MKKMIMALVAVAAAFSVNAASIKWSMANGVLAPSPDGSASAGRCSYYTMLVFTSDQTSAVNDAITAGEFASLTGIAKSTYQAAKAGSFSGAIDNLEGASASLFAVVFDTQSSGAGIDTANNYYVTGSVTQNTYRPGTTDTATTAIFSATQMTGTWTSTSVPEPTSGLLLLLGMAGLALKRKIA